ncbi:TetR/AcrR family transcriptional regulator [Sciscionella sediminilitoris]|uniref:TetR/AcrR family transcriptional regulator n=1 Tax=Sciscionella sediminilitoris TaxID=1445613 RepID=UPI0004DF9E09|nr:TetR/AcrR family transcriptional regulator [Sciscionella sp. SE31]
MARPRKITDEALQEATSRAIEELGPGFTVADVAERAGVSVGTVAGRFGSKAGLLRALMISAQDKAATGMRDRARAAGGGYAGLRAALLGWFPAMSPDVAANNVAALGVDLTDRELRALLGELFSAVEKEIRTLVRAAELPSAPSPARAARVLTGLVNGSVLAWSVQPKGALTTRVAGDLDAVLEAWRQPITEKGD